MTQEEAQDLKLCLKHGIDPAEARRKYGEYCEDLRSADYPGNQIRPLSFEDYLLWLHYATRYGSAKVHLGLHTIRP